MKEKIPDLYKWAQTYNKEDNFVMFDRLKKVKEEWPHTESSSSSSSSTSLSDLEYEYSDEEEISKKIVKEKPEWDIKFAEKMRKIEEKEAKKQERKAKKKAEKEAAAANAINADAEMK